MIENFGLLIALGLATSNVSPCNEVNLIINADEEIPPSFEVAKSSEENEVLYTSNFSNYEDEYEDNDNFETATCLSPHNFYTLREYNTSINATLDSVCNVVDWDIYYFTLFTDCIVNVNIHSNSKYGFDFAMFNYQYGEVVDSIAERDMNQMFYDSSENKSKSFLEKLSSGTYFIYLRGQQEYNSNAAVEYDLSLNVCLTEDAPSVSASAMMNSEYKAAVWISDFIPTNHIPFFNYEKEIVYYQYNHVGINTPEYAINSMKSISKNSPIHLATYYIWDPVIKHLLFETLVQVLDAYNSTIEKNLGRIEEYNLIHDVTENVIKITCIVSGAVVPIGSFKVASSITNFVSIQALNVIFNLITPHIGVDSYLTSQVFAMYKGCFDLGIEKEKRTDYEYIKSRNDNLIVLLPIYYSFKETGNVLPINNKHYITFTETPRMIIRSGEYTSVKLGSSSIITSSQENDFYCRGKIYGLETLDDFFHPNSLKQFDENFHVHNYTETYSWINNSHHWAKCKCGASKKNPHTIDSLNKKCVLCGGNANIGFTPWPNSLRTNYTLYFDPSFVDQEVANPLVPYKSGRENE